jgi:broad specificity phosphatase PhoE
MDASAYIEINSTSVTPMTYRYGDWEPPAWNLNRPEGESFEDLIDSSNSILEEVEEG